MNYDPLASLYDPLARLVFGKSIFEAQIRHFDMLEKGSNILVVGGGTGWILEHIPARCSEVTFIEPSNKMMNRARKRACSIPVNFIQKPIENCSLNESGYDVIITNFFLDQYSEDQCVEIANQLKIVLRSNGKWILTDFDDRGKKWQRGMLNLMYYFFSVTTGIETRQLPELKKVMSNLELNSTRTTSSFNEFIFSTLYHKTITGSTI